MIEVKELRDMGNDVLLVLGTRTVEDEEPVEITATGSVSALTNHFGPESIAQSEKDVDVPDGVEDPKGYRLHHVGHRKPGWEEKGRKMTKDEAQTYALQLLVEQNPGPAAPNPGTLLEF